MASGSKQQPDYSSLKPKSAPSLDWKPTGPIDVTKPAKPHWKYGEGANDGEKSLLRKHVEIDPFAKNRSMFQNYTLLISGIAPRPIGLLSTVSKDGTANLAPFSYFQVVDHDPPVFVVGFSGRAARPKDTLKNLEETGECTINTVSEHMIEAVNASSLDAPYGISEWDVSGLHQAPSSTIKPARVQEAVFSVEGKVLKIVDYDTTRPSAGAHGRLAIIEATRFWVQEDATDDARSQFDLEVLRPVGQLGGASYARITDTFELPRTNWIKATANDDPTLNGLKQGSAGKL
ncbi:uncharacterized protein K452DRAFT_285590 [Aplosporella prunicola CBS 121167]|uniref:Flavin reductase like domain-containing protein n=1 Tax=Aplosporella prunicola CBS 121167 TaxID=1176127 RepID=A0A6A6BJS0_9PEZI|nr:uncharacterized protein K452DRAFT_285590 [Aplosporella prunicola CBS 121167]KAF2143534.1 hypothetical protein K452DRAFT_285590 [Aplosporella prunicola CBS 121167]